jgi:hypothetical protein
MRTVKIITIAITTTLSKERIQTSLEILILFQIRALCNYEIKQTFFLMFSVEKSFLYHCNYTIIRRRSNYCYHYYYYYNNYYYHYY